MKWNPYEETSKNTIKEPLTFQSFLWNGILTKYLSNLRTKSIRLVSILLMKWNPYEDDTQLNEDLDPFSFNPSYEMESLRSYYFRLVGMDFDVSILLMKWNPYEVSKH